MTKAEDGKVRKVGVTRAAELYDREETVIRRWCKAGRLVAHQHFEGSPWTILIPEKDYNELKAILKLTRQASGPSG